jgi:hypothetical protein
VLTIITSPLNHTSHFPRFYRRPVLSLRFRLFLDLTDDKFTIGCLHFECTYRCTSWDGEDVLGSACRLVRLILEGVGDDDVRRHCLV